MADEVVWFVQHFMFLKISDLKSTGSNLTLIKTIDLLPNSVKDSENKSIPVPAVATPETVEATASTTEAAPSSN